MPITNRKVAEHAFLRQLYAAPYFPDHVVDRGRAVLVRLCERIEAERPPDLAALYALTRAATEAFNRLEAEFETVAEEIAMEFWSVASAYGFADADGEESTANRNW